jgi:predicted nucleic acid-binding protein
MDYVILDTNLVIDLFNNKLNHEEEERLFPLIDEDKVLISQISRIEALAGLHKEANPAPIEKFIREAYVVPLSQRFEDTIIGLRRNYATKLPDAIIAATALYVNATLVTSNTKDFAKIKGLTLWVPARKPTP